MNLLTLTLCLFGLKRASPQRGEREGGRLPETSARNFRQKTAIRIPESKPRFSLPLVKKKTPLSFWERSGLKSRRRRRRWK